jgi:hypothetical protein
VFTVRPDVECFAVGLECAEQGIDCNLVTHDLDGAGCGLELGVTDEPLPVVGQYVPNLGRAELGQRLI